MNEKSRFEIIPEDHIHNLFAKTKDGMLTITVYPMNGEKPYDLTYKVDWNKDDAENLTKKYKELTAALGKLGSMKDDEISEDILTPAEFSVWKTYLCPFEPFEVEPWIIGELYLRGEFDELSEEENELLERYNKWFEAESLKRLPYKHRSPSHLINRAQRYVKLIRLGAPKTVITDEARCLAEEMILYYYSKEGN